MVRHEDPFGHCGMTRARNDRARVEAAGRIKRPHARADARAEDASLLRGSRSFRDPSGCRYGIETIGRRRQQPQRPASRHRAGGATGSVAITLMALALLLRMLIPAGFMPATGQGFAVTPCTGMAAMPDRIDEHGHVHKEQNTPDKQVQHPCAFVGFGSMLDHSSFASPSILRSVVVASLVPLSSATVAIGRGLAAPPPPSTGPPTAS